MKCTAFAFQIKVHTVPSPYQLLLPTFGAPTQHLHRPRSFWRLRGCRKITSSFNTPSEPPNFSNNIEFYFTVWNATIWKTHGEGEVLNTCKGQLNTSRRSWNVVSVFSVMVTVSSRVPASNFWMCSRHCRYIGWLVGHIQGSNFHQPLLSDLHNMLKCQMSA